MTHFTGDLSQENAVQAMVAHAVACFGTVDVLVNNAGGGIIRPFLEHDAESLQITLARNLWTTIWCCHKALPLMVAQNHGRIINIGADSLRTGIPNHAAYNAAKGGVVGLTVGLARDWAHLDITVNTVSPCAINSGRLRARLESEPALAKAFLNVIPKGRGAEVEEISDLVYFLSRKECSFITGQDFSINGGSAMP
ncbi:2,3-dihydroxy-2,3-dihydro-p-cumate dehydrogenase [Noviherbaspirillum sp. Root189]|nr:2,3-dihydroxy-2,3-dihydro-p-cumate dehydrogenase [Noviherbaspirillum sp. Root189]